MINQSTNFLKAICFLLLISISINLALSQTQTKEKKWHYLTDVYMMFPYMNGEAGIGKSLVLPVEANPGDIFSKLQMGGFLYLEANTNKWAITSDLVFMNLNQEVTQGMILYSGSVTAKQLIWGVEGLYRVLPFWEMGIGSRLNTVQTSFDGRINVLPAGTEEISGRHTKTWVDPIIVSRLSADINDKWLFQGRGDLGGFGIGSDFTWQLQAYVSYRFTKLFQCSVGYRYLAIDYNYGDEPKEFIFDMNESGPVFRFGFNF